MSRIPLTINVPINRAREFSYDLAKVKGNHRLPFADALKAGVDNLHQYVAQVKQGTPPERIVELVSGIRVNFANLGIKLAEYLKTIKDETSISKIDELIMRIIALVKGKVKELPEGLPTNPRVYEAAFQELEALKIPEGDFTFRIPNSSYTIKNAHKLPQVLGLQRKQNETMHRDLHDSCLRLLVLCDLIRRAQGAGSEAIIDIPSSAKRFSLSKVVIGSFIDHWNKGQTQQSAPTEKELRDINLEEAQRINQELSERKMVQIINLDKLPDYLKTCKTLDEIFPLDKPRFPENLYRVYQWALHHNEYASMTAYAKQVAMGQLSRLLRAIQEWNTAQR